MQHRNIILNALHSMCTNGKEYRSRTCRVHTSVLPSDHDISQLVIAGRPIFALVFAGPFVAISCPAHVSGTDFTAKEAEIAVEALSFVLSLFHADSGTTPAVSIHSEGTALSLNIESSDQYCRQMSLREFYDQMESRAAGLQYPFSSAKHPIQDRCEKCIGLPSTC